MMTTIPLMMNIGLIKITDMEEKWEVCKTEIAQKYGLGNTLVTGHREKYFKEAALLMAKKLKK